MPRQVVELFQYVPRSRSSRALQLALLLAASLCQAPSAFAAQTKSYVLSWIVPAMYAHEGDCKVVQPVAEPGGSPIDTMYRGFLRQMGKTEAEIAELIKTLEGAGDSPIMNLAVHRGRIDGKPVNVYKNPESAPDPQVHTVIGPYGIGFNLDGKGADEPGSFQDPYTKEKGVDNQFYRALGCFRSSRAVSPAKYSQWEAPLVLNMDDSPAVLITVSGKDLSRDGEVVVTFARSIERTRLDASHKVRRDMTFRVDPGPRTQVSLQGKIKNGEIILEGGHLKFEGKFATVPFELTNTHMRLKVLPDGSLDGLLAGYQPWRPIYHFYYGIDLGTEAAFGIDIVGVYYALKKLADGDPDPVSGENRRISITYAVQAVPAFVIPESQVDTHIVRAPTNVQFGSIPMATPPGITIQVPAGGGNMALSAYRERMVEDQYFADANGMALYTYDQDKPNESTCYEDCAKAWPPLLAPRKAKAFGEWSVVKRNGGARQWAYLGKPLYRFAKDTIVGEANGVPKVAAESPEPSPWKLASYTLAQVATPNGISVHEVVDANGEALVDTDGMTLYTFDGDARKDKISCNSQSCESAWIPYAAARVANPVGDFTLITRPDGLTQWAYKGKGLYRYRHDQLPGHAKGVGGRWQAALVKQFYLPPKVRIQESFGRGKVLADEHGMTLYRRSGTRTMGLARSVRILPEEGRFIGTRSCDAECMKTWIPFEAPKDAQPTGFWEVLSRADGKKQWSYKGYALYRYAGDEKPGDVKGSLVYDLFPNPNLQANAGEAAKLVADLKSYLDVALIWSHMYP